MLINTEVIFESHDMVIHRKIKEGAWQSFIVFFNFFPRRGKFPFGWNGSRMALGSEYDRLKNFSPEIITEIELFLIKNYSNSENKYISNASVQDVAELTIKETNAVFSKNISAILSKISFFDEIKRLSNSCFYQLNLTGEVADKLHCDLNQGVLIIKTEWHLLKYMHAYGDMHQAKLKECFDVIKDLPTELNEKNIQIIDYGCGQGVGSIVFIDFLRSSNLTKFFIQKIILIEPSELALRNASLNVKYCLESISKNTNVLEVNKKIEQIDLHDLSTDHTPIELISLFFPLQGQIASIVAS